GYTPYIYPHPLVTGTNVVISSPGFTLTVVNGTGGGSYASNSVVSISANETSNQTFACWNGPDIANTNAASTTVTMPGSNLTVTAYYTPYPPGPLKVGPAP
ncbi:MAG: InlB B-repeat-containing protein, partial [Limisphaerales bacterium]